MMIKGAAESKERLAATTAVLVLCSLPAFGGFAVQNVQNNSRPRARDLGITVGVLPTGPLNAITDVAGVAVGQTTVIRGDNVRTGVTAILPHQANLFMEKVPGAVFVGNGPLEVPCTENSEGCVPIGNIPCTALSDGS